MFSNLDLSIGFVICTGWTIGCILLYGELADIPSPMGQLRLMFKDVWKRDSKTVNIDTASWEDAANNSLHWRTTLHLSQRQRRGGWQRRKWRKQRGRDSRPQVLIVCWLHLLALCFTPTLTVASIFIQELDSFVTHDAVARHSKLWCLHHHFFRWMDAITLPYIV